MKKITRDEIARRIRYENPWWDEQRAIDGYFRKMVPRAYLDAFHKLVTQKDVNRAVVLMGPRRVGKTVLIHHFIQRLIDGGVDPRRICYVSIEAPVYTGCSLEEITGYYREIFSFDNLKDCYIFFDEIQYLKDWEKHLKRLVDDHRDATFVASGSAAAALKRKSMESGAGRFTDIYLPPLTFHEFIRLRGKETLMDLDGNKAKDLAGLNDEFINYINFGGYPEAIFSEAIQSDPGRYIRSDVIDKVLLRDLPSIYGIADIQELNKLFMTIAYNTGNEVSLDALSQSAGVAKNTIKKYLEYLEAAFLVKIIHRVDQSGKRFLKANFFKVYLTNPSIRCALFGPVSTDHEAMGNMVETAIVSQLFSFDNIYYARWKGGEVDVVFLKDSQVSSCHEIKWSNRFFDQPGELQNLIKFAKRHGLENTYATTIDKSGKRVVDNVFISFMPASIMSYRLSKAAAELHTMFDLKLHL
ncbi:MAG: ATP-binding protein [Deltaproteobacteria bacterium]|nr:ATP-binding protein [Deltaproteobacteria bacterium]